MIKKSKTCIAITTNTNGKLMMAGDRCVSFGDSCVLSMQYPKVNKKNGVLLGASGNGDLCSFFVEDGGFKVPKIKGPNINKYMFFSFKKHLMAALVSYGYGDVNKFPVVPEEASCELLIGIKGQAWGVDIKGNTISLNRLPTQTNAIGCGGLAALAIMQHELTKTPYLTKQQLKDIFKTVGTFVPGCDTNCDIIEED